MKSEWRVRYNPNLPENPYNAYRLRDAYKVVEGGNIEPDFMYYETESEAKERAAQLNKEGAER